ncbi:class IV adenylate cyclase [Streptomyces sp. HUAS ZL42]|uniref:class IV adenylate cyclase n=1 Tax=Streptomyces sp. HUAS ZL42 TaxID=3231715 RepID=UPI00345E4DFC
MPTEFEAKILNIDPAAMSERILARGGRQVRETALLRRYVYDIVPGDETTWMRLRSIGDDATISVKRILHDGIDGTEEFEISVSDFDTANVILGLLGFIPKSYQENRRTSFVLDGAEVEIDEWPLLTPYLEIEAESRDAVISVAAKLGYDEDSLTGLNTMGVYAAAGINLRSLTRLTFDSTSAEPGEEP